MKIYLPNQSSTYLIDYEGTIIPLTLVTSVAFYKAKMFHKHNKWQVVEDSEFLKDLINKALASPTKENLDSLLRMEQYYMEVNGNIPVGTPVDQAEKIRERRNSSLNDLYSQGLKADELTFNSITTDSPTLGQLVDDKRKEVGRARNAFRKKKPT